MTADALAELAERTNVPTLEAVDARLEALRNVPPEYRPMVDDAREYRPLALSELAASGRRDSSNRGVTRREGQERRTPVVAFRQKRASDRIWSRGQRRRRGAGVARCVPADQAEPPVNDTTSL